jgi:Spy/CpxP family protein refolding chaperone
MVSSKLQWRLVISVLGCLAMACSLAQAQPGGRGGRGGFGGGFGGSLDLLQDDSVRRELELTDEQSGKLRDIQDGLREEIQSQAQGFNFGDLRDLSEEERQHRFAEFRKRRDEITAKSQKEVDQVLLPNQRERLKQLAVQQQIRFQGVQGALAAGTLAEKLNVTDEQKEKLAEKAREVHKKLQEAIEKARQEAQDEIVSVLSPEQQAQLKEMMGSSFVFQSPGFGGQVGFGGQPGGRGGSGGRGGRGGEGRNRAPSADD